MFDLPKKAYLLWCQRTTTKKAKQFCGHYCWGHPQLHHLVIAWCRKLFWNGYMFSLLSKIQKHQDSLTTFELIWHFTWFCSHGFSYLTRVSYFTRECLVACFAWAYARPNLRQTDTVGTAWVKKKLLSKCWATESSPPVSIAGLHPKRPIVSHLITSC